VRAAGHVQHLDRHARGSGQAEYLPQELVTGRGVVDDHDPLGAQRTQPPGHDLAVDEAVVDADESEAHEIVLRTRNVAPLGGAPRAVPLRLDDAAPADFEQPFHEGVVQVSVGEGGLYGNGQAGAGDANDSRRPPGDRRGHVEGRSAQQIAQNQDTPAVMADGVPQTLGVVIGRFGGLEGHGGRVRDGSADKLRGGQQRSGQRSVGRL